MSDYYTEKQVRRIEEAAHQAAIRDAGKEWERQRDEFNSRENDLESCISELERRITKAKNILESEMRPWHSTPTGNLPDHYLQLRQALDVLNGGGA